MRRVAPLAVSLALVGSSALVGCGEQKLSREALLDPETCADCHPDHYREWSGSMHAYASFDPVFLAMNARGQRETSGALGDFCVKCHAPMAVREGATTDGLNLAELPKHLHGVTCYFCHNVTAVEGTHNNPLALANDILMRGGIPNPVESAAHEAAHSALHDRGHKDSSALCGSCHDIVTPKGVHLERTFLEWKESLYANDNPAELQTCGRCHMPGRDGLVAQVPGVFVRRVTDHSMPGVDIALDPFPEMEAQRALVQRELDNVLHAELCVNRVDRGIEISVDLENVGAGHAWPSGATQDRRAWVEVIATLGGRVVFETGVLEEGECLADLEARDPNVWRLGDKLFGDDGREVHMFWDAARYEGELLPAPTARAPWDPRYRETHVIRKFAVPTVADRVTMRVRIRPMGLDVLDDLIASGDLDPVYRERMPIFDLGSTVLEWSADDGKTCIPQL